MHGCPAALKCCYSNSLGGSFFITWNQTSAKGKVELLGDVFQYPESGRSLCLALYRDGNMVSVVCRENQSEEKQ